MSPPVRTCYTHSSFSASRVAPDKEWDCLCCRIQNDRKNWTKMCISFCQNLEENRTETCDMIKVAFAEDSMSRTQVF